MPAAPVMLRATNLNLIPILCALLREANVSRAAQSLGLSQSATSGALGRLRLLLGDPILVQVGRSMRLTPRAQALIVPLEQLVGSLGELLSSAPFDPRQAERQFVVATPDYIGALIGNGLIEALKESAPKVSAYFIDVPSHLADGLNSGQIDLAIVALDRAAWAGLTAEACFEDRLVWLVSRTHPLASRSRPSVQEVGAFPIIRWRAGLDRLTPPELESASAGHSPFVAQQFTVLPLLALESQCVALVPKTLADRMAQILPLAVLEMEGDPRPIRGGLLWSPVQAADPAHKWFRTLVGGILTRQGAPELQP